MAASPKAKKVANEIENEVKKQELTNINQNNTNANLDIYNQSQQIINQHRTQQISESSKSIDEANKLIESKGVGYTSMNLDELERLNRMRSKLYYFQDPTALVVNKFKLNPAVGMFASIPWYTYVKNPARYGGYDVSSYGTSGVVKKTVAPLYKKISELTGADVSSIAGGVMGAYGISKSGDIISTMRDRELSEKYFQTNKPLIEHVYQGKNILKNFISATYAPMLSAYGLSALGYSSLGASKLMKPVVSSLLHTDLGKSVLSNTGSDVLTSIAGKYFDITGSLAANVGKHMIPVGTSLSSLPMNVGYKMISKLPGFSQASNLLSSPLNPINSIPIIGGIFSNPITAASMLFSFGSIGLSMARGIAMRKYRPKLMDAYQLEQKTSSSQLIQPMLMRILSSKEKINPIDILQLQTLMLIEGHTSIIPMIQNTLQEKFAVAKSDVSYTSDKLVGEKSGIIESNWYEKPQKYLEAFRYKFDPFTQLFTYITTGKKPKDMLREIFGKEYDIERNKKVQEEFGINLQSAALLRQSASNLIKPAKTYQSKILLLVSGIFDLMRQSLTELITIRKNVFGINKTIDVTEEPIIPDSFFQRAINLGKIALSPQYAIAKVAKSGIKFALGKKDSAKEELKDLVSKIENTPYLSTYYNLAELPISAIKSLKQVIPESISNIRNIKEIVKNREKLGKIESAKSIFSSSVNIAKSPVRALTSFYSSTLSPKKFLDKLVEIKKEGIQQYKNPVVERLDKIISTLKQILSSINNCCSNNLMFTTNVAQQTESKRIYNTSESNNTYDNLLRTSMLMSVPIALSTISHDEKGYVIKIPKPRITVGDDTNKHSNIETFVERKKEIDHIKSIREEKLYKRKTIELLTGILKETKKRISLLDGIKEKGDKIKDKIKNFIDNIMLGGLLSGLTIGKNAVVGLFTKIVPNFIGKIIGKETLSKVTSSISNLLGKKILGSTLGRIAGGGIAASLIEIFSGKKEGESTTHFIGRVSGAGIGTALGMAVGGTLGPVGSLVGGFIGSIVGKKVVPLIFSLLGKAFSFVKKLAGKAFSFIGNMISSATGSVKKIIFGDKEPSLSEKVGAGLGGVIGMTLGPIGALFGSKIGSLVFPNVFSLFTKAGEFIKSVFVEKIPSMLSSMFNFFKELDIGSKIEMFVLSPFQWIFNNIIRKVLNIPKKIIGFVKSVLGKIPGLGWAADKIMSIFSPNANAETLPTDIQVIQKPSSSSNVGVSLTSKVKKFTSDVYDRTKNTITGFFTGLFGNKKKRDEIISTAKKDVSSTATTLMSGLSSFYNNIISSDTGKTVISNMKTSVSNVKNKFNELINQKGINEFIRTDKIKKEIDNNIKTIKDSDIFKKIKEETTSVVDEIAKTGKDIFGKITGDQRMFTEEQIKAIELFDRKTRKMLFDLYDNDLISIERYIYENVFFNE